MERFFDGNLKPLPNQNGDNGTGERHNGKASADNRGHSDTASIDGNGHVEPLSQTQEILELLKSHLEDTKAELGDEKSRERRPLSMLETEEKNETAYARTTSGRKGKAKAVGMGLLSST